MRRGGKKEGESIKTMELLCKSSKKSVKCKDVHSFGILCAILYDMIILILILVVEKGKGVKNQE